MLRTRGRAVPFCAAALAIQGVVSCGGDDAAPARDGKGGTSGRGGASGSGGSVVAGKGGSAGGKGGSGGSSGGKGGRGGAGGGEAAQSGQESDGGEAGAATPTAGGQAGGSSGNGDGGRTAGAGGQASAGESSGANGGGGESGASDRAGAGGRGECSASAEEDADGDGWTGAAGDCDDCAPLVNPGAFEVPGDEINDDCDASTDGTEPCDEALASGTSDPFDFAKALELCRTTTLSDGHWGVVDAKLTLSDGMGVPYAAGHAVRPRFGTGLLPTLGEAFAVLSTGNAAAAGDIDPTPATGESTSHGQQAAIPADFLAASGGAVPQLAGCPSVNPNAAYDSEMLSLQVRVPSNARSFSLRASFYSFDFPEWVCSAYNDFFVVLLDSQWDGTPANPPNKNLAAYESAPGDFIPMNANLAYANTGLFTQCVNGVTGCGTGAIESSTNVCVGTAELVGTGFDAAKAGSCNNNSLAGGATGWRTISGNVVGGEVIMLRIGLWDSGDDDSDSTVILDAFEWSTETVTPGAL